MYHFHFFGEKEKVEEEKGAEESAEAESEVSMERSSRWKTWVWRVRVSSPAWWKEDGWMEVSVGKHGKEKKI